MSLVSIPKLAKASFINIFYLAIQSLVFLMMTPITFKKLGGDLFGYWTIMLSIMGFAGVATLKVATSTMKYIAQYSMSDNQEDKFSSVVTINFLFVLISGIFMTFLIRFWRIRLASMILSSSIPNYQVVNAISILSLGVIPLFFSEVSLGILLGLIRNGTSGFIITFHHLALWIGAYFVGNFHGTITHLASLIVLVNVSRFLSSTFAAWYCIRDKFHPSWDTNLAREIIGYTISIWVGAIGLMLFNSVDRILVGIVLGTTIAGVYGIGTSIASRISIFADQFSQVLNPYSSKNEAAGYREETIFIFRRASQILAVVIAIIVSILAIWMNDILAIWISPEFAGLYSDLFRSLIIAYAFYSMFRASFQILQGLGWIVVPNLIVLCTSIIMLAAVWLFGKLYGFAGAVYANYVYALLLIVNIYLAKHLGLKPFKTVINDIGMPIILLSIIAIIPFVSLTEVNKIIVSILVLLVSGVITIRGKWRDLIQLSKNYLGTNYKHYYEKND